uniref:Uncharacterized protein n=1 Tax=viral metagenome TaxID=1070528 RepID=A0A6C0H7N6_9ZZZZ
MIISEIYFCIKGIIQWITQNNSTDNDKFKTPPIKINDPFRTPPPAPKYVKLIDDNL